MNSPPPDEQIREIVSASSMRTSAQHDSSVLAAARLATTRMSAHHRRPRQAAWWLGLAASFVLGAGTTSLLQHDRPGIIGPHTMTMPSRSVVRGVDGPAMISVEEANPDDWYRYIQELLYEGNRTAALAHLERFNEMHPDYVHQP